MSIFKNAKNNMKLEKEKLSELSLKQKWEYFCDYYLFKTVITLIVIGCIIALIVNYFTQKKELALNITVVQENVVDADILAKELTELFGIGKNEEIIIDGSNFLFTEEGLSDAVIYEKLCTRFFTGDIDIYIGTDDDVDIFGKSNYFIDLRKVLDDDLYNKLLEEDRIYFVTLTASEDDIREKIPVGVIINNNAFCQKTYITLEPTLLCISRTSVNDDNVAKFIDYVLK